jgi:hypothetical protein
MANHTATAVSCDKIQRAQLERLESSGRTPQKIAPRARIILKAIRGEANSAIAEDLQMSRPTVLLWRNRFVQAGVPGILAIPKLDLRAEATSTQLPTSFDLGPNFLYHNGDYHDSNTNKGELFGNQTSRDGRSYQGWTTYHFSAVTDFGLSYRDVKTSNLLVPGGGTQSDGIAQLRWRVRPDVFVNALFQYERWLMPFVKPGVLHDVTSQISLTFKPHLESRRF